MSSSVTGLLPHASSMLLIDELISNSDNSALVGATIRDGYPFSVGGIGAWIGLELLAQAAAVVSRLRNRHNSEKPSLGFLLGSRSFTAHTPEFLPGQRVFIEIQIDPASEGQSAITALGVIRDVSGLLLCEGGLTLFEPNDDALYLSK